MNVDELKKNLHDVIERYRNKEEFTGEVRRDVMARDCLQVVEELEKENELLKGELKVAKESAERIKELESQLPKWKILNDDTPKNKYLKFLRLNKDGKFKSTIGFVRESVFGVDVVVLHGASVVSESFKDLKGKSFYLELTLPPPPTTEDSSVTEKEK